MSKYEYTDTNDSLIKIGPTISNDQVFIQIRDVEVSIAGYVRNEDAPAIALAILEAAGVSDEAFAGLVVPPDEHFAQAHRHLGAGIRKIAEQAEREAEDAKVRAWWDETRYGHTTSLCWAHMGESAHEDVRKQYHLARKFFEGS